jgi:AAA+ superfamily predicted ATPase
MGQQRTTRKSGKKPFSFAGSAILPVDKLIPQYAYSLLSTAPLQVALLGKVLQYTDCSDVAKRLGKVFKGKVAKFMEDFDDPAVLASVIEKALDKDGFGSLDRQVRNVLLEMMHTGGERIPAQKIYRQRLKALRETLQLDDKDIALVEFFACYQLGGWLTDYVDSYLLTDRPRIYAGALNLTVPEVCKKINRKGTLAGKVLLGIFEGDYSLENNLYEYLVGISDDFLSSGSCDLIDGPVYPLSTFPLSEDERMILNGILQNSEPCNLLFHGRPGTGKTELAKTLAAESGRSTFLARVVGEGSECSRQFSIINTIRCVPESSVIIMDEADVLLNTKYEFDRKGVDKGWINNFMDKNRHKIIWISNDISKVEPSVLRRFNYSVGFNGFTNTQRTGVLTTQLHGHPLEKILTAECIDRLSRKYAVDAGGIASAVRTAGGILAGTNPAPENVEKLLGCLLSRHQEVLGMSQQKKLVQLSPNYDISALNTDMPAGELLTALRVHLRKSSGAHTIPVNIMFWGLPGTGKTEFAKYMARELGKELLVKNMSDLSSKWVGDTERNISEAFREARESGSILFLDEADSLFIDRKTATRSWESSQTNELLTQMENFEGICICCTNLLEHIDEAALRRFSWKVKFLPLMPEGAEKLFQKYFHPEGRLPQAVKTGLQSIRDLTPGDFKTVFQRQQYREQPATAVEILAELRKEVAYKRTRTGGPIGFAA